MTGGAPTVNGWAGLPTTAREARDMAVTWLAHLKREPLHGLPVPWINRYGPESAAATRVDHDPWVGGWGIFHDDHGELVDFTRQNMGRQREAMMRGLCQVCGRQVPWSRRNLIVSGISAEAVEIGGRTVLAGRTVMAVHEPWLDDRCAAIARLLCPELVRRGRREDLNIVPVRSPRDVDVTVSVGRLDLDELQRAGGTAGQPVAAADLARLAPWVGHSAAMWVKIVLKRHRIVYADEGAVPSPG